MIDLLSGRPGQLLAETLLHFLWQGAAIALVLFVLDPLLRTVGNKYAASLGALVLMLALPVATCYVLAQRELGSMSSTTPAVDASAPLTIEPVQLVIPSANLSRWQPLFVGLWLTGVLLLAARLLMGYLATLWLRGDRRPLPAQLAHKVAWLGRRLGVATRCRVFLSSRISEAIAVGCFKPLVLIPLAWASELPPSALEAVVAHELAHIRRWDLWATLLQRLAETLLFYHPAIWWLSRRLSQQRELCCDALAVSATRSPADYVLALETIARRTSAPPLSLATSFLGGGNMNLLDRVRHVLAGSPREASAWWPAGLAALAAPLLMTLAVGGWSLLPRTVTADEVRDASAEAQAGERSDEEAGLLELAVRLLAGSDEDGTEEVESEEAARQRKREAVRERETLRELQAAEEALARESQELEELEREAVRKRSPKKQSAKEFDLSDFKPETEREAKLMAVIKKLQSQVKDREVQFTEKVKRGSGGPPESKDPRAIYEYKILGEKRKQDEQAYKRAITEKDIAIAKEREAKELAAQEYKRAVSEKEIAMIKEWEAKERAAQEYKRALAEKHAILNKEREAKERASKEENYRQDLDAADQEAYRRVQREKETFARKQKEAAAAAEKDAHFRKFKGEGPNGQGKVKGADDEVESLRRVLREREAELQKAHQALKRAQREAAERERLRKDTPEEKDPDSNDAHGNDKEGEARSDARAFDDYVLERLDGLRIRLQDQDDSDEGERLWLNLFGARVPESN